MFWISPRVGGRPFHAVVGQYFLNVSHYYDMGIKRYLKWDKVFAMRMAQTVPEKVCIILYISSRSKSTQYWSDYVANIIKNTNEVMLSSP